MRWVVPLCKMFRDARTESISAEGQEMPDYDFSTYNGRITFETFMAAIGKTPRELDPDDHTA